MIKKILYTIIILFLFFPITVRANIISGNFTYMPAFDETKEEKYYYDDDYFINSGKTDNEHLLTMSINLALSTFEDGNDNYSTKLLNDIGFSNIKSYDMKNKPTLDTIGMVIGTKKIDNTNIIAVAIRGAKYGSEWGNSVIAGKTGDVKGLSEASLKVIDRIKDYINDNNLSNVKLWITGYSRAGALADITGVYINNHLDEFNTNSDDLYIYTFEAPKASSDNTIYENIYNVVNKTDIIPLVYPSEWGLYSNGKVIEIGEDFNINTYYGTTGETILNEIKESVYINEFITWLSKILPRDEYSDNLDERLSNLLNIYFSKNSTDQEKMIKFFKEDLLNDIMDDPDKKSELVDKVTALIDHHSDYIYHDISNFIVEELESLKTSENASIFTSSEYQYLEDSIYPLLKTFGPVIIKDIHYYEGIDYDEYYQTDRTKYYMDDSELGKLDGLDDGKSKGYFAGFHDETKDLTPTDRSVMGPGYVNSYNSNYISNYEIYYNLGQLHLNNLSEKGKYDGYKDGYSKGYDDYVDQEGKSDDPYNPWFYPDEWMTDEYIHAYNSEYKVGYSEGYDYASSIDAKPYEPHFLISLYHFRTLINNLSSIISNHYPQNNLILIQNRDSYYQEAHTDNNDNNNQNNNSIKYKTYSKVTNDLKTTNTKKLLRVDVDEKLVNPINYEIIKGSKLVKLKDSYLDTLLPGKHKLRCVYNDEVVEKIFYIENEEKTIKKTTFKKEKNNNNSYYLIFYIIIVLLIIITFIVLYKKNINSK